ncbi:MAG: hypothetical protein HY744_32355 [Deltaproteobacteria bacterium]|nr:hypothetical protein [Deltaproteobacteria bacterium]
MRSVRLLSMVLGIATTLLACGNPIVGEWQSEKKLGNGQRNKLVVNDDQSGEALIYATPATNHAEWHKFKFDLTWEEYADGFELAMDCKSGGCDHDDFKMTFEIVDEGGDDPYKMDCKANKSKWTKYPFDWEFVPEE